MNSFPNKYLRRYCAKFEPFKSWREITMATTLAFAMTSAHSDECSVRVGEYSGTVKAEWLTKTREMRLLEQFFFKDPNCKVWAVPKGAVVDGASIPQPFWSLIGGPFEGRYRDASVVHDYYCKVRTEPSDLVHEMFYYAMLANGVDSNKAGLMFYLVSWFGPKWQLVPNLSIKKAATPSNPFGIIASSTTIFSPAGQQLGLEEKTAVIAVSGQPTPFIKDMPRPALFVNRLEVGFEATANWLVVNGKDVNQSPVKWSDNFNYLTMKRSKANVFDIGDPKSAASLRLLSYAAPTLPTQQEVDLIAQWITRENPSLSSIRKMPIDLLR